MNPFQKQLLLKDDRSMAELSNPARDGIGQPLSPARVSIEEFTSDDADFDYASTPHPSAHYNGFNPDVDPDLIENIDRFNRL